MTENSVWVVYDDKKNIYRYRKGLWLFIAKTSIYSLAWL